jgi:NAD(P)-dependent dehydrogenase (short-subunit alcohol dehydrogenase family)
MKTVLITGASTGIGRACAIALDRHGFRVLAGVRREQDGEALREESPRIEPVIIDVTDQATIDAAAKQIDQLFGLVNNAGITVAGALEFLPVDDIRRQFEVNVFGQIAVTQAFLPKIRASKGRIVFMSSVGGRVPSSPFMSPYNGSKHALESFGDALRVELQPSGIDVVLIEPGSIATPIWEKSIAAANDIRKAMPPEFEERYGPAADKAEKLAALSGKRGIPAEKVAQVVVHALVAEKPKPRYVIGREAKIQKALFAVLPDRARDGLFGRLMGLRKRK